MRKFLYFIILQIFGTFGENQKRMFADFGTFGTMFRKYDDERFRKVTLSNNEKYRNFGGNGNFFM